MLSWIISIVSISIYCQTRPPLHDAMSMSLQIPPALPLQPQLTGPWSWAVGLYLTSHTIWQLALRTPADVSEATTQMLLSIILHP